MPPLAQPASTSHFTSAVPSIPTAELAQLRPGLWVWHAYDPSVKTELFSSAVATAGGLCVVDPIPLAEADLAGVTQTGQLAAVIVTNTNHQRAAFDYSDRFSFWLIARLWRRSSRRGSMTFLQSHRRVGWMSSRLRVPSPARLRSTIR